MRTDLPFPPWADLLHRAVDDAFTLTVAAQADTGWGGLAAEAEPALTLHTEVPATEPVVVTITL
ncbi:MAG: hypothetical protein KGL68_10130 [Burkholderiales bacterium]|nr:hypothetical protein [Burkholderiales bacterium]